MNYQLFSFAMPLMVAWRTARRLPKLFIPVLFPIIFIIALAANEFVRRELNCKSKNG